MMTVHEVGRSVSHSVWYRHRHTSAELTQTINGIDVFTATKSYFIHYAQLTFKWIAQTSTDQWRWVQTCAYDARGCDYVCTRALSLCTCVRMHVSIKYSTQHPVVTTREVCIWHLPLPHPACHVSLLLFVDLVALHLDGPRNYTDTLTLFFSGRTLAVYISHSQCGRVLQPSSNVRNKAT